jgi:hypothetical protein
MGKLYQFSFNRIQHFWVFTNLARGVCYAFLELAFCIYFNFVFQIVRVSPKIKIQRG